MKKFKKIISLMLVVSMLFACCACGDDPVPVPNPPVVPDPPKEPQPLEINVIYDVAPKQGEEADEAEKRAPIEAAIKAYFEELYDSVRVLEVPDMTKFFTKPTGEQALINQAATDLLVNIRKLRSTDLRIYEGTIDCRIVSYKVLDNGNIKVQVNEDSFIKFMETSDIETSIYDIQNYFTFKKVGDSYKITSYDRIQDYYILITGYYTGTGKEELDKLEKQYLDMIEKQNTEYYQAAKASLEEDRAALDDVEFDVAYDRDSAYRYAMRWVEEANPDWRYFTDANCQNFGSQVMYAGGIPFDKNPEQGEYTTWFSDETGFVSTWTFVPAFTIYAANNKGEGLVAVDNANFYLAEPGDIIQVGVTGPNRHTIAVVEAYEKDGEVVDVLINSNTINMKNFPMSAYVYPVVSLIKIMGYNEAEAK